eukprot:13035280-Ditylum_brightwellii.AAC.1
MLLLEDMAFMDKEVSILNLLPPGLLLEETTAQVSAEKTAAIKDIVDMPTAKRSKMSMSVNTIGLCKTKENALETITNWLSLLNHNFVVNALALLLLYGAFFMLADLITSCDYKNWYDAAAVWWHEQAFQSFDSYSNDRETLGPCPFVCLYNAASDLVRDIE